mgnify:CR=1 FL=1
MEVTSQITNFPMQVLSKSWRKKPTQTASDSVEERFDPEHTMSWVPLLSWRRHGEFGKQDFEHGGRNSHLFGQLQCCSVSESGYCCVSLTMIARWPRGLGGQQDSHARSPVTHVCLRSMFRNHVCMVEDGRRA